MIGQTLGMQGHFQVLVADDRFSGLRMALNRNSGMELPTYEILVSLEDQSLELAAELADFARERGLESRFEPTGEVSLFELV